MIALNFDLGRVLILAAKTRSIVVFWAIAALAYWQDLSLKEMAGKPPVIPELFSGDKSWDDCIFHFESVAEVYGWDGDSKLKWFRVH